MTEHSPTSAAGPAAEKPLVKSKTFWLQIIVFASSFLPVVQEWLATNPVPVISALAALGVLVRFVTHGKVRIFSDSGSGTPGAGVPLFVVVSGITAAGLCVALPSCSALEGVDVDGKIYYRADNGAKGGIDFVQGKKPALWWRFGVPIVSKEGGLVPAKDEPVVIEATK